MVAGTFNGVLTVAGSGISLSIGLKYLHSFSMESLLSEISITSAKCIRFFCFVLFSGIGQALLVLAID